jgi:hypothetical protein
VHGLSTRRERPAGLPAPPTSTKAIPGVGRLLRLEDRREEIDALSGTFTLPNETS